MGACMDKPRQKKSKIAGANRGPDSTKPQANPRHLTEESKHDSVIYAPPKYKKMTVNELLLSYRIESTLQLCSKMEGPKYLSNIIDGSSKILRIITLSDIDEKRLDIYRQNIGFQVFQNDEGSLMILDEYCSGEDLYEIIDKFKQTKEELPKKQLLKFICEIFGIISEFHKNQVWLGNLNLSSFRKISCFNEEVRLVDFNFTAHVTDFEKMGFAHKESYEADLEFMGYLIQFMISEQPPIFIPHKMQYIEYQVVPHSALIQNLLKGKRPKLNQISQINQDEIILNEKASLGYRFRRDINKLLKMRKKRKGHNRIFYGEDTQASITEVKFNQQAVYRIQTQRILQRIRTYIHRVRSIHEESFLNYSGNNDSLRQLKEVFLLTEGEKKMIELRECLSNIK